MKKNNILFVYSLSGLVSLSLFSGVPAHAANICTDAFAAAVQVKGSAREQVREIFKDIYKDEKTATALAEVFESMKKKTLLERPKELLESDLKRLKDPNWLEDQVQLMLYVDSMGSETGKGTFKTLNSMQSYLLDTVGVTQVYTLPVLKSPRRDAGFDVQDYKAIDPRYGGNKEFGEFAKNLRKRDGTFQLDIILNHVSSEHAWAKAAIAGDPVYRKYFHILESEPKVVRVIRDKDERPMAAIYSEKNEKGETVEVERRVIFPDFADPNHPHYVKMKDASGNDIWVYHTFYPFQFDLNYTNPRVMSEALGIVSYWANQGIDVIRLDAIPFLFKDQESDPRTMKVVEGLRHFLAQASPRTAIIVEANQPVPVVYKYYGKAENIRNEHFDQVMKTTSAGQLAYNFDLMAYTWASLLSKKKSFFLESLERTPEPPQGTVWANFLRVHDELTLEMVPDSVRDVIRRELLDTKKGVPFRGDLGVGGRMANFLDHHPRRIAMAFSLGMLGLRGLPIIYYGDEIMASSNHQFALKAQKERGGQYDSRDDGRGPIAKKDYDEARTSGKASPEGALLLNVQRMIQVRKQRVSMRRGKTIIRETSHESAVAYSREIPGRESTLVVHNLSDAPITTTIQLTKAPKELFDLLLEKKVNYRVKGKSIEMDLPPFEVLWLAL